MTFSQERSPRTGRVRKLIGTVLLAVSMGGIAVGFSLPAPYVIESPGPVFNVLGDLNSKPILTITNLATYPTDGALDALTVSAQGTPGNKPTWIQVLLAWMSNDHNVIPMDSIYPPGVTDTTIAEEDQSMMDGSQQVAIAVALRRVGININGVVAVQALAAGMPAEGVLKAGDQIVSVNGIAPKTPGEVSKIINAQHGARVTFVVKRNGADQTFVVKPEHTAKDPVWRIGIYVGMKYLIPKGVSIDLGNVTGPSAGMMFTLGLIDKLTPGSLTGGVHIAGTGTISSDESIGAIGGIALKMKAAASAGAKLFIGPRDNCDEIIGNIPKGMQVATVTKLSDALDLLAKVSKLHAVPTGLTTGCPTK